MNIIKQYEKYNKVEDMFICPICSTKMRFLNENSIVCKRKHCFDLSKHGYINFVPNQHKTKYTKELFESRRYIFENGFYKPLEDKIINILKEYTNNSSLVNILDIGCGEGFYARSLSNNIDNIEVYAMDNSKESIILAAKKEHKVKWFVGDLANIPIKSESMDLLLNIFTPANYNEFLRILKRDRYIVKVIPGENYLKELRESAVNQLSKEKYSNKSVIEYFKRNMICKEIKTLSYKKSVNKNHINNFINMTPMMFNVDKEKLNIEKIKSITFDFIIIIGKK